MTRVCRIVWYYNLQIFSLKKKSTRNHEEARSILTYMQLIIRSVIPKMKRKYYFRNHDLILIFALL